MVIPIRQWSAAPPGFGLRQSSGAFEDRSNSLKAPGDWRSAKRWRAITDLAWRRGVAAQKPRPRTFTYRTGALMIEFLVAMALVMGALIPLAYSFAKEKRLVRALYQRAIAMEIVDGEMELLAGGGWKGFTNGVFELPVKAAAASNLPPGRFLLTKGERTLRLEWKPAVRQHGGSVIRQIKLP